MSTNILKRRREMLGITLEQASQDTNIPVERLVEIENSDIKMEE